MKKFNAVTPNSFLILTVFCLAGCGATASKYEPIVDGPVNADYSQDLLACQTLSESRRYDNDDVKSEAAVGAAVGALFGAIEGDSLGEALIGSVLSGALFAGDRAWETRDEKKEIIISCMSQRGHRVVG